jgi:ribosomal-protein-alanine N-acetyltransferase
MVVTHEIRAENVFQELAPMANRHEWHTPRLLIREFREQDAAGLNELHTDPEATRFIGGVWPPDRAKEILPLIIRNYQVKEYEWFAVTRKEDAAFLGACWLAPMGAKWCEALKIDPPIELGYRYVRRHWGQGYATEAGQRMLRRGFEELDLSEIASIVRPDNVASDRVLNKLSMQYRRSAVRDGITAKYYTLSREQYRAQAGG